MKIYFLSTKKHPLASIDVMQLNVSVLKSNFGNLYWTLFYNPDHCARAKRPINRFQSALQKRLQTLRSYSPIIYTVGGSEARKSAKWANSTSNSHSKFSLCIYMALRNQYSLGLRHFWSRIWTLIPHSIKVCIIKNQTIAVHSYILQWFDF